MAVNLQVGGAVRADAWYGVRPADTELPELLRRGGLGIVLAPRQMGKSSLRLRAAARLAGDARIAQVDLAGLGTEGVDPAAWFGSLAAEIAAELGLPEPTLTGPPARGWASFVGDLLDAPLVVFLDEIDVLRRLPFAADVLGAVRAVHERAAIDPRWARLGVCLLGAASPEALGAPLNVGHRVALRDFAPGALAGLREALGPDVVDAIYAWTSGHPYLTLRLAAAAADGPVDALVDRFFLAAGAGDTNLAATEREVLLADGGEVERIEVYRRTLDAPVPLARARPAVVDALVLCGLAAVRDGALCPRNRIASTVFDAAWAERVLGQRSIRASVRRWTEAGRTDDELPHGRALAAHRAWSEGRADLSPDEHALLRRAAEVEAEQEVRRNAVALARTRGRMVAALSVVGVALALTAGALVRERDIARQQALRANELRLAAEAVGLAGTPRLGEQALSRAVAAADLDPSPDPPEVTRAVAASLSAMSGHRSWGHRAPVVGVGCGPDGAITSVDADGRVFTWPTDGSAPTPGGEVPGNAIPPPADVEGPDDRGPERLRRLDGPGVALSWEGDHAVLRRADGAARVLPGHAASGLRWASFTSFGLLTLGHDDTLRRWDAATGEPLGAFLLHEREPLAIAVCGLRVVTGSKDGTVGVWEVLGGAGRAVAVVDGRIGAAWSGHAVLVGRGGHRGRVDPDTGAEAADGPPAWHPWEVDPTGRYAFDGDVPAIVGPDGARPLAGVGEPVYYASWSADGRRIAGATPSGRVYVWDVGAGDAPPASYADGPDALPCTPVFGPGGLAVGDDDGGLWYLDRHVHVQAHPTRISAVAWAADGRLATASLDHTVGLWDGARSVGRLIGHASHVRAVAWSPDGARLATGGDDRTVRLWTDAGQELAVLRGHDDIVRSVAFSADGERLVSASDDGVVIVWPGSPEALVDAARAALPR